MAAAALLSGGVATGAESGRLSLPDASPRSTLVTGLQRLGGSNGLLYIPLSAKNDAPLPLLILLHKAGGSPSNWFPDGNSAPTGSYAAQAEAGKFAILAPEASGATWGDGPKSFGGDFVGINAALKAAFERCPIDRNRLAIGGFSDGGSYALSLGLANGDLFRAVIAFSPGFIVRSTARGRPALFISHGRRDLVLPTDTASRLFVPALRKNGYNVTFDEFGGGHNVPDFIRDAAMKWLIRRSAKGDVRRKAKR